MVDYSPSSKSSKLFFSDYAAGDAVAGVARGIGLLVISIGVHYECGASVTEE